MNKPCNVTIKATKNPAGEFEFDMDYKGGSTELLVFDKAKDGMKTIDEYLINFTLENGPGINLAFVSNANDVMYVKKGSDNHLPKCPKNGSGNGQTPFQVVNNPVPPTTLTVRNPDADVCFYKFALRFEDRNDGNKIVTFDPIYDNRNGGSPRSAQFSLATGIGGAAAGALITMLIFNVGLFG